MSRPAARITRRADSQVFPLELFFDLVFVFAVTQCTSLMVAQPTWAGLGRGLLALAVLWWGWTAYAWLTSVIDPEQDAIRITMFAAMGAMLVVSMCVPQAFGDLALPFALAYLAVRTIQIVLFVLASPEDPDLRRSVVWLGLSSAISVGLLVAAAFVDAPGRELLWVLAIVADFGGPLLFGSGGWRLVPGHFAERHGAIIIIALGESIVAIGVGAGRDPLTAPVIAVAVIGVFTCAALWWLYFDVVALATQRRLSAMAPGQRRNALARDAYSFGHLVLLTGIVLFAVGVRTTMVGLDDRLSRESATALCGGVALYLWGHVAFRYRFARTINRERLAVGVLLVALVPVAAAIPAWAMLLTVTCVTWLLVAYETLAWSDTRAFVRQEHGNLGEDQDSSTPQDSSTRQDRTTR